MVGRAKRRNRRAARAESRQAEFDQSTGIESREGLNSELLTEVKNIPKDLALVNKALRWRTLTETKKRRIVDRLFKIVDKEFTTRLDSMGEVVHDEEMADKNAMFASSLLLKMEDQKQKDEHLERRLQGPVKHQPQTTINVGVNVDNRMDERRSRTRALIERAGAERGIQLTPSGGSAIVVSGDGGT